VILGSFLNCSCVGIPDSVVWVFVSSTMPKISEGDILDLADFGQVWVPPGSGPLGDSSGRCANPEHPQDQMVQVVEVLFISHIDFLW